MIWYNTTILNLIDYNKNIIIGSFAVETFCYVFEPLFIFGCFMLYPSILLVSWSIYDIYNLKKYEYVPTPNPTLNQPIMK